MVKSDPFSPLTAAPYLPFMHLASLQPTALLVPYSASKFAVRGLTQGAAMEWGKYGIRVVRKADLRSCILSRANIATAFLERLCTVSACSPRGILNPRIG